MNTKLKFEPEYDFDAANERMYELKIKLRDALDAMGAEFARYQNATHAKKAPIKWEHTRLETPTAEYIQRLQFMLDFEEILRRNIATWLAEEQRRHTARYGYGGAS